MNDELIARAVSPEYFIGRMYDGGGGRAVQGRPD